MMSASFDRNMYKNQPTCRGRRSGAPARPTHSAGTPLPRASCSAPATAWHGCQRGSSSDDAAAAGDDGGALREATSETETGDAVTKVPRIRGDVLLSVLRDTLHATTQPSE